MSHFIGLVFEPADKGYEEMLAPYCEQDENYFEFRDETEDLRYKYENEVGDTQEETCRKEFPKYSRNWDYDYDAFRARCLKTMPSKEMYPTFEDYANAVSTYNEERKSWGYFHNPRAKWDWYSEGGRWECYLRGKDGECYDKLPFVDIDWKKVDTPFCFVDTDGEWHERGEMGWWACVSNEKEQPTWDEEFAEYIQSIKKREDEGDSIMVYAIDFHI